MDIGARRRELAARGGADAAAATRYENGLAGKIGSHAVPPDGLTPIIARCPAASDPLWCRQYFGKTPMPYAAPLADMRLVLDTLGGLPEDAAEIADAVLGEAAKFAENELAPLNQPADRIGSVLENGVVRTPPGFPDAYRSYVEGGWNGITCPPEIGGQGLPLALALPLTEMWNSACMSWALCPLLNSGAVEMLRTHGSPELKVRYLDRLVSGEWPGTMNLTEPQAGSDLGALRTRAAPADDPRWGKHYRITGQKIFITYGDHDLAPNIIHMVLARIPEAPPGSRGISLFLVPKFLPDHEGGSGSRNDIHTLSLERK